MTVVIEHVRHRVDKQFVTDPRFFWTVCRRPFTPFGQPRDFAHHHPAKDSCRGCYAAMEKAA